MPKSKKRKVDYGLVQERSNMESEQVNTHKETVGKRKSESVEEKEIKMDEITAGKKKVEMKNRDEAKDSGIEDSHSDSDKLTESDRLIALQNELDNRVNDSKTWAYDRVTIIGNDEVINKYKACLPEKNRERIDFVNVENNKAVVKKIILSDIQPNKQLIVAHLNTSNMKKVNKWSEEILSSIKSNDFLCMSLVGREKSNDKGALFATVPGSNNIPPVRQVIDQYLQSQGVIR